MTKAIPLVAVWGPRVLGPEAQVMQAYSLFSTMARSKYKTSYCPSCVKNVPHFRLVQMMPLRLFDIFIGPFAKFFRIGPWYCLHCERRQLIWLRWPRLNAVNYRMSDAEDDAGARRRKESMPAGAAGAGPELLVGQSVGNFIKSERSLTLRRQRLERYSEKYRDSLVQRLLDGQISMAELRGTKELSEREILDWIADRMQRLEEELEMTRDKLVNDVPLVRVIARHDRDDVSEENEP